MKARETYDHSLASRAAARQAHFAAGNCTASWRGRSTILDVSSSKARQNKRACRDRSRWDD